MNWVQRRVKADSNLKEGTPGILAEVTRALEAACESYNAHYATSGTPSVTVQNAPAGFTATKTVRRFTERRPETITVSITQMHSPNGIKVAGAGPVLSKEFLIKSDEDGAFITDKTNERIDADELSKRILEPLLFPEGQYVDGPNS